MTTPLSNSQRLDRIRLRASELACWRHRLALDLHGWRCDGQELGLGSPWPQRDGVIVFEHPGTSAPRGWPLEEAVLELDLGGEALVELVYDNGERESFGHDPYHRRYPLRRRAFSIRAEGVPRLPLGAPNPSPRLARARLVLRELAVEELCRRLQILMEAAAVLGDHDVAPELLECAEECLGDLDLPSATGPYLGRALGVWAMTEIWERPGGLDEAPAELTKAQRASVMTALASLDRGLAEARARYPEDGGVALTGHAHLDLAWLWPIEETRRKARRTYASVSGLIERYPELIFNQSSAQLYDYVREDDPDLFAAIKRQAASGRWEPVGGMWVEPDANMPCGESLVRQLLYGQRFFERHFGSRHNVCWLPDCFGFTPALPQILRSAGIDYFFTHKLNWSESTKFPFDLFWWEGLDGSRVLAHSFNNPVGGYNGDPGPETTYQTWANYGAKHTHPETLLAVGYGDGGGGPNEETIERARAAASWPALPRLRWRTVADFFADAAEVGERLPVWAGELYLEYHRGTLTTQGRTKRLHRRAERDLVAAEVAGALAEMLDAGESESMEDDWRVLLRNQFHDILPGSGIREVYVSAEAELAGVVARAGAAIDGHLERMAEVLTPHGNAAALLAVNPDISPRSLRAEAPFELPGGQRVEGGSVTSGVERVPGLGATVIVNAAPPGALIVDEGGLENDLVRVTVARDGTLASVYDKRAQRELLDGRGNQLWAYVDKPRAFDAWEIDAGYTDKGDEVLATAPPQVVEAGPHRAALRIHRRFRDSVVTQDVRLWSGSARIDFHTTFDWHDRHWLLKARFPLALRSSRATFETAFGAVERATHRNTAWDAARFEVPGHRFADLSEPAYGAALLNDGRYGYHALRSELGLTLLRSPTYPDPLADEGTQHLTYSLYPHPGGPHEGGVVAEAEDLNRPLLARPVRASGERSWSGLQFGGLPLGLGALKPAEDTVGLVLRVYEPLGASGRAEIRPLEGWSIDSEVNLLEDATGKGELWFSPFQVRSFLVRRAGA